MSRSIVAGLFLITAPLALSFLQGCPGSKAEKCSWGAVCPPGEVCHEPTEQCVLPRQISACRDKNEYEPCEYPGSPLDTVCRNGICIIPRCGDSIVDQGEDCDGENLGDATCESLGMGEGTLACHTNCTFDTSGCELGSMCGNNVREDDEVCDGEDLGGETCVSQGYYDGTLACLPDCSGFEFSGCSDEPLCTIDDDCEEPTPFCVGGTCMTCRPNSDYCIGNSVYECNEDGSASTLIKTCDDQKGEICSVDRCKSLCELAEEQNSYIGCEYWPTTTTNPQLSSDFDDDYGIVLHNGNEVAAEVTITKGGSIVAQETVAPGQLKIFQLTFDLELKDAMTSMVVSDGAHHLVSSVPITVYQFNPLNYKTPSDSYSYSNDASLLLPAHVLSMNYMIMARPTFGVMQISTHTFIPGFFAVTATEDNTNVIVNFSGHTEPGGPVGNQAPGSISQYQLNRGEVLQVLSKLPSEWNCSGGSMSGCKEHTCCEMPPDYDLTGTTIQASKPVAVFSGHACAFVPYNVWACDHLQQQMIPSEAWGQEYVVAITEPQSPGLPEPNVIKVLSRENNNTVTFYPISVHHQISLDAGEYVEFESNTDFHVVATQPTMVAQFMVGQEYHINNPPDHGDPAFALVVPFEQYRDSYTFVVPETMTHHFVNIIAEVGESGSGDPGIFLNGAEVSFSGVTPIGNTTYGVVRIDLSNNPITHHTVTGLQPFGIMVYGFAKDTSYFYPGGFDLESISPVQ